MYDAPTNPLKALRAAMGLPQGIPEGSRELQHMQGTYQRMLLQLKHIAEQDRLQLEATCQKLLEEQAAAHEEALGHMIRSGVVRLPEDEEGHTALVDTVLRTHLVGLQEENKMLRAQLQAKEDEVQTKIDYALYQQRVQHEASLQQLCLGDPAPSHAGTCLLQEGRIETPVSIEGWRGVVLQAATGVRCTIPTHQGILKLHYNPNATRCFETAVQSHCNKAEYEAALTERERAYEGLLGELRALRSRLSCLPSQCASPSGSSEDAPRGDTAAGRGPASPANQGLQRRPGNPLPVPQPVPQVVPQAVTAAPQQQEVGAASGSFSLDGTALADAVAALSLEDLARAPLDQVTGAAGDQVVQVPEGGSGTTSGSQGYHQSASPDSRTCARCGKNNDSSPGVCRFHPYLLSLPGPLLGSPEWHACKTAGHDSNEPGCFLRQEHYYPSTVMALLLDANPNLTSNPAVLPPAPPPATVSTVPHSANPDLRQGHGPEGPPELGSPPPGRAGQSATSGAAHGARVGLGRGPAVFGAGARSSTALESPVVASDAHGRGDGSIRGHVGHPRQSAHGYTRVGIARDHVRDVPQPVGRDDEGFLAGRAAVHGGGGGRSGSGVPLDHGEGWRRQGDAKLPTLPEQAPLLEWVPEQGGPCDRRDQAPLFGRGSEHGGPCDRRDQAPLAEQVSERGGSRDRPDEAHGRQGGEERLGSKTGGRFGKQVLSLGALSGNAGLGPGKGLREQLGLPLGPTGKRVPLVSSPVSTDAAEAPQPRKFLPQALRQRANA
eukprot:jgi/Botrbrau1/19119/Bobra.0077s0032.1